MKKWPAVALALAAGGVALLAVRYAPELLELTSRAALRPPAKDADEGGELSIGREPLGDQRGPPEPALLPDGFEIPRDERELRDLVARLRSLGQDELLRLSNAEFEFQRSELVELLQKLSGEWVVPALAGLALDETDPLLKAILVEGLVGSLSLERGDDPRMLPLLTRSWAR
jgi:hypothetical protein